MSEKRMKKKRTCDACKKEIHDVTVAELKKHAEACEIAKRVLAS